MLWRVGCLVLLLLGCIPAATHSQNVQTLSCPQIAPQLASVTSGVREPKPVKHDTPTIPAELRSEQATIGLQVLVQPDGKVGAVTVVTPSNPRLAEMFVEAAKRWEYTAPTIRGVPVYATLFVAVALNPKQ